jgi:hypothetical protein
MKLCPTVPEVLSTLTLRLLAKTPEAGYPDANALQEALDKALDTAPASWDEPFPVPRGVQRRDLTRSGPVRLPQPDDAHAGARPPRNVSVPAEEKTTRVQQGPVPFEAMGGLPLGKTERAIAALRQRPSAEGVAPASVEFRPPTRAGPPPFVPPEEKAPQAPAARSNLWGDTAIRKLAGQMRMDTRPRRRFGALQLVFLGAAVLVVAAFVVKSLAERPAAPPKSLLERYQEELTAEQQTHPQDGREVEVSAPKALPAGATGEAPAPTAGTGDNPTALPPLRASASQSSPPSPSDAKAIQAELERTYGSKRPTLPGKGPPASAGMPSWVKGVEVVDAKPAVASGDKKLGGRYGDHLRLQLRSNLDSRLCGSGAVEAVLVRPYVVNGEVVLPVRTLAYGQCSPQGARFLVAFNRLRLPDGSEAHFDGVAMDVGDGKPGLLANRRLGTGAPAPEGLGGNVARGAASTVLGAATSGAGVGAQMANGAGQTVLSARPETPTSAGENAILLDQGAGIDVFVRQAF